MRNLGFGLAVAAAAMTASTASAAVLLSDDMSTSANWTIAASSADTASTFGFDYSTVGVPPAPGASNTLALKLEANIVAPTGGEAIIAASNTSFSGQYNLQFDMWQNYTGPLSLGGAGSTEFIGGGIGHDGVSPGLGASGASLYFTGDAGSGTDLRPYENGVRQTLADGGFNPVLTGLNHPNIGGELGLFPAHPAPAAQVALFPTQIEFTRDGAAGFAWRHYSIFVDATAGKAVFFVDGVHVVSLDANDGNGFSTTGKVALLYSDLFSSVAGNPAVSFGLFTNVVVTDVPEPASLALLGLGGLAMLRRR